MDLNELQKRKLEELQNQALKQQELQTQLEVLETVAKQHMTQEAIARYGNVKSAHQEKAIHVITMIVQALQTGKIQGKITDAQLKELLLRLQEPKKDFKIRRT